MTVRMRHTSGHTKNRRSHHGLKAPRLSRCAKCGAFHLRHRVCEVCGTYRKREVIDVNAKITKKAERKTAKMKERGLEPAKEIKEKKTKKKEEKTSESKKTAKK